MDMRPARQRPEARSGTARDDRTRPGDRQPGIVNIREEFLNLLRSDPQFRERVRRELLTDELLGLPGRFDDAQARSDERLERIDRHLAHIAEVQARTDQRLDRLTEQVRTLAETVQRIATWQEGEEGRRRGERYEAEMIRRAPALFMGGEGGATHEYVIRTRVTELLAHRLSGNGLSDEENPFLADLIWWKGGQIALAEVSVQVDASDVHRAAQRAETLRLSGAPVMPMVIGDKWAMTGVQAVASGVGVEWKVGDDLSDGFVRFRTGEGPPPAGGI